MGNLKPCGGCGKMLDASAPTCPGCGRPSPTGMSFRKKVGIAAFSLIALLYVIGRSGEGSTSSASSSSSSESSAPAAPVAIEIAAPALFRAYEANEVSADDAYKGKHLAVAGRVASIDVDFLGHVIVRLSSGNTFQTVDATMQPSQKPATAGLHKGAPITVLCVGNGKVISPQLEDCVIQ